MNLETENNEIVEISAQSRNKILVITICLAFIQNIHLYIINSTTQIFSLINERDAFLGYRVLTNLKHRKCILIINGVQNENKL